MADHPNVERMRQYLEAFDRGDLDAAAGYFSDDIIWHVAGDHPLSGDYSGKDNVMAYLAQAKEYTSGTLNVVSTAVMANDKHIAMFVRVTGQRKDKTLDIEMAETFTVAPDGSWSEFYSMPGDQEQVDAFWSE